MVEEFDGTSDKDRNYVYMKEIMIRGIIKLDNMETVANEEVMNMRRDTIYFIQQKTQQLMAKLKENQEAAEAKRLEEEREQHKQNDEGRLLCLDLSVTLSDLLVCPLKRALS